MKASFNIAELKKLVDGQHFS
jgi:hypothetical protein